MEKHNYAFFGKEQAFIIVTKNYQDQVHLNFIRKVNEKWQQLKEGIHIKLNLEELCKITKYFESENVNEGINIIHQFSKEDNIKNFKFQFNYDRNNKDKKILFIKAKLDNKPDYRKFSKPFKSEGEKRLLVKIFQHLENEKISNYQKFTSQ